MSTTIDAFTARPRVPHDGTISREATILSWLLTTDHKRIGVMYLVAPSIRSRSGVLCDGCCDRAPDAEPTIVSAMTYNRLFTLHGVIMVLLFLIPSIPSLRQLHSADHARREGRRVPTAQPP